MNEEERQQQQMAEIGSRFLKRTLDELEVLEEHLRRMSGGEGAARQEFVQLVHRIYGSSAMFGFEEISGRAGVLEDLARSPEDARQHIAAALAGLKAAVQSEARARLIE